MNQDSANPDVKDSLPMTQIPTLPAPMLRRGEQGARWDMFGAEQLRDYARTCVELAHPEAPPGTLPDLPQPTWHRGMYGSPLDLYTDTQLSEYSRTVLEQWVDPRDALIDELQSKLAFIEAGALNVSHDELISRITAVGAQSMRVGHWLSDVKAQVRAETLAAASTTENGRTRAELVKLLDPHQFRTSDLDCAGCDWKHPLPGAVDLEPHQMLPFTQHLVDVIMTAPTTDT